MDEKDIENYLKNKMKKLGGIAYKFVSPGMVGVPDRICILPLGIILFVELKAPHKKPRKSQQVQIRKLQALGQTVLTISSKEHIDKLTEELKCKIIDRMNIKDTV